MTTTKTTTAKNEVQDVPAIEGLAETLAAAPEGQVVLRHPTAFGVTETVQAAEVDRWKAQGWLVLK